MLRRIAPVLAAALGAAALVAATTAFAHGHHGHHHAHHLSAWDKEWLMMSIEGDRFEIAGGQLAQSKGQVAEVKALGARLVADHSKSLADAVKAAKHFGVEVPDSPSPSQQWELQALQTFSGNAFDRQYASLEVLDHMQDIQESRDEVKMGSNHRIRKLAKEDLPVLKEHLKLSKAALAAAGG
jgi:putative membrane protein